MKLEVNVIILQKLMPHIFGYLREADKKEYEASSDLRLGDKIGKSGLELIYENNLRGNLGIEFLKSECTWTIAWKF